jgi:hypothetical protein
LYHWPNAFGFLSAQGAGGGASTTFSTNRGLSPRRCIQFTPAHGRATDTRALEDFERHFVVIVRQNWAPEEVQRNRLGYCRLRRLAPRGMIESKDILVASEAGQMAATDYVPIFFKKPLASRGASTDEYAA